VLRRAPATLVRQRSSAVISRVEVRDAVPDDGTAGGMAKILPPAVALRRSLVSEREPKNRRGRALRQLSPKKQRVDRVNETGFRQQLVRVREPKIGEHVAAAPNHLMSSNSINAALRRLCGSGAHGTSSSVRLAWCSAASR